MVDGAWVYFVWLEVSILNFHHLDVQIKYSFTVLTNINKEIILA